MKPWQGGFSSTQGSFPKALILRSCPPDFRLLSFNIFLPFPGNQTERIQLMRCQQQNNGFCFSIQARRSVISFGFATIWLLLISVLSSSSSLLYEYRCWKSEELWLTSPIQLFLRIRLPIWFTFLLIFSKTNKGIACWEATWPALIIL